MQKYLVALSGGADSVCLLLYLLKAYGSACVEAAHCNFHLRAAESEHDEAFVRALCAERKVRLHVAQFDTRQEAARTGESVEMAARRLRYDYFLRVAESRGISAVAVAHHQKDQAETVLLNLTRGTSLRGLCGMPAERELQAGCSAVRLIRPLLHWTKAEILAYLAEARQTYVEDSTNADVAIARNAIRHAALPALEAVNEHAVAHIAEAASRLRRNILPLVDAATDLLTAQSLIYIRSAAGDVSQRLMLERLPQGEVRRAAVVAILGREGFTEEHVDALLNGRVGSKVETAERIAVRGANFIDLASFFSISPLETAVDDGSYTLNNGAVMANIRRYERPVDFCPAREALHATLDADAVGEKLHFRRPTEGERFAPWGLQGTKLVADYLADRRCSRLERMQSLVLADEHGILWLAGHTVAQRAAVTAQTKCILEISLTHT